jgi:RNA polymerase sigma-70 factor (ECF subfamily)
MSAPGLITMAASLGAAETAGPSGFEQAMRRYERLVLATALRLLGNLADAQDAAQEVFLRLYRNRNMLQSPALAGWLYRVTVNVCHDLRRRRPEATAECERAAEAPDPQQLMVETERRRVLEMSLRVLAEKERAALVLRDLEGLSTSEVAHILGSSEATVRSQISKARVKMRDFVERYFRRRS